METIEIGKLKYSEVVFGLPEDLTDLEAMATVMVLQALKKTQPVQVTDRWPRSENYNYGVENRLWDWFEIAGIPVLSGPPSDCFPRELNYGEVLRALDQPKNENRFYPDVLAEVSGLSVNTEPPKLSFWNPPRVKGAIVLAPFSNPEMEISMSAWRLIVRFLRSFEQPVVMVGAPGQRIDMAGFTEAEILSGLPVRLQASVVNAASLVLGTPNAFTWTAAGAQKPSIILYPDHVKPAKYFPFNTPGNPFRILAYPKDNLEFASLMTGLRFLINNL